MDGFDRTGKPGASEFGCPNNQRFSQRSIKLTHAKPLVPKLPLPRHRTNLGRLPGRDDYLSVLGAYPFHTHSMACGRNCAWALLTLWRAPRQNRYWYS